MNMDSETMIGLMAFSKMFNKPSDDNKYLYFFGFLFSIIALIVIMKTDNLKIPFASPNTKPHIEHMANVKSIEDNKIKYVYINEKTENNDKIYDRCFAPLTWK